MLVFGLGSPGSGEYGMEMDDMQGHMDDMDGMEGSYGDEGMVRYIFDLSFEF